VELLEEPSVKGVAQYLILCYNSYKCFDAVKLLQKSLLLSAAFLLTGCNPVPSNCLELARSALKHSFEEAPNNNGLMITRVFIDPPDHDAGFDDSFRMKIQKHQYILSINNSGKISEDWWTFTKQKNSEGFTDYGLVRDPSVTKSPNVPEPEMKSSTGIVCKLGVHDNTENWEWDIKNSIRSYNHEATLSQDSDGFHAKWE
jgi:hypothetical protein